VSAIAARLAELGIVLPAVTPPKFSYVATVQTGNLLFVSGHTSTRGATPVTGRLGAGVSVEDGYRAARMVAVEILATVESALGSLDRVTRVVKLLGMVNAVPEFTEAPAVINGASDLLVEVFGERGRHARSAFGVAALPANAAVEIEAILEVAGAG
jgi:enamine deaminase RidA (YjgF/YER057c/UK114 family)